MESINLIALGQFTIEDIGLFLSWLDTVPAIERTLGKMKKKPPVGNGKLSPVLKVLDQLGFVRKKQECFSITLLGEDFLSSNPNDRKAMIRTFFLKEEEVQRIIELLNNSMTGRIPKYIVNESFGLSSLASTAETEILSFLVWAHRCELFGYDNKKKEIFRLDRVTPRGPFGHVAQDMEG